MSGNSVSAAESVLIRQDKSPIQVTTPLCFSLRWVICWLPKSTIIYLWGIKVHRWLGWRIENWGTKWEPSQILIEANQITFLTALQPPQAALARISRLFPRLRLTLNYETQGHFGYGVIAASDGHVKTSMYDPDKDSLYLELEKCYDQLVYKLAEQGIDF